MISKQDILERATEWHLRPDVVEKDYVLGWLLAGLAQHPITSTLWIFKGGTCIKKCYFETYRFSEDLDFSLLPAAPYTATVLRQSLVEVAHAVNEMSGLVFPENFIEVKERRNKQGEPTFQGKLAYGGPLRQIENPTPPRVLIDITNHEPVLENAQQRSVFHPYPDSLPEAAQVFTYSMNELLAEKTRALLERTRPRDLYDVIYILDSPPEVLDLSRAYELFKRKCGVKAIPVPTIQHFATKAHADEELRSEWANMLMHQLPDLPEIETLLARLSELLMWIEQPSIAAPPRVVAPSPPMRPGESRVDLGGIRYWGSGGTPIETIRFAGANRLLVEFTYHGKHRLVEPYSLRRAGTGNILLNAWELTSQRLTSQQMKSFIVAEISGLKSTHTAFTPRFPIELVASGTLAIPVTSASNRLSSSNRTSKIASHGQIRTGPTYVFRCPNCGKEFRHSKNDSSLRKHKNVSGFLDCPGRRGYYVRTDY